nr:CD1375 family protein [Flavonifractor sp. An82]
MAKLYADLIQRGLWTIEQVPTLWREEVENILLGR